MEVDSNGGVYLLTPRDEKRKLTVTYVGFTGNRMNSQDRKYVAAARISNEFVSRLLQVSPKRRLKQHNGEIQQGAKRTLKYRCVMRLPHERRKLKLVRFASIIGHGTCACLSAGFPLENVPCCSSIAGSTHMEVSR